MTTPRKEVRAKDLVRDIRSGMTSTGLKEKYRLSEKGLRSAFRKLLDVKAIAREDILNIYRIDHGLEILDDSRRYPRKMIRFPFLVCDADSPDIRGFVRDCSKKGMAVEGISASVGELRALRVRSNELAETSTFEFVGRCRWALTAGQPEAEPVAGFEIIDISTTAFQEFRKLI